MPVGVDMVGRELGLNVGTEEMGLSEGLLLFVTVGIRVGIIDGINVSTLDSLLVGFNVGGEDISDNVGVKVDDDAGPALGSVLGFSDTVLD